MQAPFRGQPLQSPERPDVFFGLVAGLYVAALVSPAMVLAVGVLVSVDAGVLYVGLLASLTVVTAGVAFGYALFCRQLFDLVPATRQLGRNAAISQLDAGIVIVDDARRVVYCTEAAAGVLGCEPQAALGQEVRSFTDESLLDFEPEDALAEIERDESIYEVRTSTITDRSGERIGHTLVFHDVTVRKRRERELASQRDELRTVNELNATIRGVNQALVSASGREEVERAVCERLADGDLSETVCVHGDT